MSFEIDCLGASREVGRSAFLVKTDKKLLLDYGIKIFDKGGKPKFPEELTDSPDAMLLSHAHLDHSGFIPNLYKNSTLKWYSTPPTKDIVELLIADSMKIMGAELPFDQTDYIRAFKYWSPALYEETISFGETEVRYYDAGHIAGSAMIELNYKKKTLLYTGDFKKEETKLHGGINYDSKVDVLMVDCTYARREHPERKKVEQKLADEISETIREGGSVLLPAFALGRSQELIRIIRAYNRKVPVYLDGMGKDITDIYLNYGKYITDAKGFKRDVGSITKVKGPEERMRATRGPSVIVSSAGMLEGGPALRYLTNLNPESKIIFTGYNVEGTNGWRLLNKGELIIEGSLLTIDLPVEYFDFSAHAGRKDVMDFIKTVNPEKIICIHGDSTEEFATELREIGYDAIAPKAGEHLEV